MAKTIEQLNSFIEQLNQDEEQTQEQTFEVFQVTDLDSAAEAQRRIAYFHEQMAEIDVIVQKQLEPFLAKVERIKEWGEQAKQEYVDKVDHYSLLLETFIRNEVATQEEKGKKPKKTIKLPYGSIALKKQQPEFVKEEEKLLEYAKVVGLFKVKETTDWAELKKKCQVVEGKLVYEETGEIVPGVTVIERGDKFELKLG